MAFLVEQWQRRTNTQKELHHWFIIVSCIGTGTSEYETLEELIALLF